MSKFAVIGHPLDMNHLYHLISGGGGTDVRERPRQLMEKVLEWTPPYKLADDMYVKSIKGSSIEGYAILCPLLTNQMVLLKEEFVVDKIAQAVRVGEELGARIAGLTAFTSIIGAQGEKVAEKVNIPVTTGNTFTTAAVLDGIEEAAKLMGVRIEDANIAIIGASGDIGSACCRALVKRAGRLTLSARNRSKLENFVQTLGEGGSAEINIIMQPNDAVKEADIVISVTSAVTTIIDAENLKSGAIVCDAAMPKNIGLDISSKRDDILVFDGGMVQPMEPVDHPDLPLGFIFGCVAETMLLTLEERYEPFSIGRGNINLAKVDEVSKMAIKHGFSVNNLKVGTKIYSMYDIDEIKRKAGLKDSSR